jgi:hypothetical protein
MSETPRRRRLTRWVIGGGLALIVAYFGPFAVAALFASYPLKPAGLGNPDPPTPSIRGAFHIHSTLSDGRGTPSEIVHAAKEAGLQFIVMTDHNLVQLAEPRYEEGVLVISAVEESTAFGHVVALGTERGLVKPGSQRDPVGQIAQIGGYSILAHPVQRRHPWTDLAAARRASGLELYSGDTLFRDALDKPFTLLGPALGAYATNSKHAMMAMLRQKPAATELLLELSMNSPKVALCAQDAHGRPPYRLQFEAFSTHVPAQSVLGQGLPTDPARAAREIIFAMGEGRTYCAFDILADASGFAIQGLARNAREAKVGDRLLIKLPASSPQGARLRVWGGAHVDGDGRTVVLDRAGPVHLEVWVPAPGRLFGTDWKPWIVPSPVLVRPRA